MTAGWSRKFHDPVPLPDGRKLVTLLDAANYATKLPKKEAAFYSNGCSELTTVSR
jgi:hypothetical protein